VDLPLSLSQPEVTGDAAAGDVAPMAGGAAVAHLRLRDVRILLVDDDPDTLQMLTMVLEMAGGEVRACASATEAFDMLGRWKADLLVSDIGMPNEDGYSFIRRLRAQEAEQGQKWTPAIALTAFAGVADRSQALSAGFQTHVAKPVEPNDLIDIIARLAGPHQPVEERQTM